MSEVPKTIDWAKTTNWDIVLSEIPESQKVEVQSLLLETYLVDDFPILNNHPVVMVKDVIRFKQNKIINYLVDSQKVSLNDLAVFYYSDMISLEDWMDFYRWMGYSLCGFVDVFAHRWLEKYHPELEEKE